MRSTRATAAVERLKTRSGNPLYSMLLTSDGMFSLMLASNDGTPATSQGDALPQDAFVKFVDGFGPQTPRRATKNDLAFEAQLTKRNK